MRTRSQPLHLLAALLLALGLGCSSSTDGTQQSGGSGGGGGISGGDGDGDSFVAGPTDFVSADAYAGQQDSNRASDGDFGNAASAGMGGGAAPGLGEANAGASAEPREVTEGDIYRVLDTGTILNLNSYRGLQVIDVRNPAAPRITARLSMVGTPVEMYVRGTRVFVLLNDWQGYYGSRADVAVQRRDGGLLVAVDLSNRNAPRQLDTVYVEGRIMTSRLVANDAVAALYLASSSYAYDEQGNGSSRTFVTSFDASGNTLVRRTQIDLGGYVTDIQATPEALLVASQDWWSAGNTVAVVDISNPSGQMVLGDQVRVAGYVRDQFNMDLYKGVLRVASNGDFDGAHVETFDASDIQNITPLDHCRFGNANEQLYATLFLGNKAFFVTFLRQDPFHAFEIKDDGECIEHNEFIVSGWNDFLRPVMGGTRLIGVGSDSDEGSTTPAVSLYDITDLANPSPLLDRDTAGSFQWSWSEAQQDHRVFSVLENAVSVQAADGTIETGLVLLPYTGWSTTRSGQGEYFAGATLFTFSDRTVTRRGAMPHDDEVRRSFLASDDTTANLSETALALYDHSDPNDPQKLGQVDLAPDYGKLLRFGNHIARVKRPNYSWNTYDYTTAKATVQIVRANADLNTADPIAEFEVPASARLLKAGDLLVAIDQQYVRGITDPLTDNYREEYRTTVDLHDLSNPASPRARGSASTDELMPTYFGYYGSRYCGQGGFIGCGMGMGWFDGSQADGVFALGDKVVFADARSESELIGRVHHCSWYAWSQRFCGDTTDCLASIQGSYECQTIDGVETCSGDLYRCTTSRDDYACEPVSFAEVEDQLTPSCWDYDRMRYWSRYAFKALDVSNPDRPTFGPLRQMPRAEEGVSVLPDGSELFYTYRVPTEVDGDSRAHVRYYYKRLSFENVNAPSIGNAVNIPGELIAVDGERAYTKDLRWGENHAVSHLHELVLRNGLAYLQTSRAFDDRDVTKVVADDGTIFVVHQPIYHYRPYYYDGVGTDTTVDEVTKLTILAGNGLRVRSETSIDSWATLEAVHGQRALFTVPGGLLMTNVEDLARPYAQAFFYSNGWPEQILFEGNEVLIAAGRYGIERFDASTSNLLSE